MNWNTTVRVLLISAGLLCPVCPAEAEIMLNADVRSLTLPASAVSGLNLPVLSKRAGMVLLPFYLQVNYSGAENMRWGMEIYSDNRPLLGNAAATPDGLFRGLRGNSVPACCAPWYWQVYSEDQQVSRSWGTPGSVTTTAGGMAFSPSTVSYWGEIYDCSDADKAAHWSAEREKRLVATYESLGGYPQGGRSSSNSPLYVYFAADLRSITLKQQYVGGLTLQLESIPFDFSHGCFATPNPVKPVRGQQVFFNFFTNQPDSEITIEIFDPTGYRVRTVSNSRFWDCRNDQGHLVEGGLYIYQISTEGHLISGTVVVIK